MATIKPQQNQNIFDIALQEYGSVEGIFELLADNDFNEVDTEISVYEDLQIVSFPRRKEIRDFYALRNLLPANGITAQDLDLLKDDSELCGIDYMEIGEDFIVEENNAASDGFIIDGVIRINEPNPKIQGFIVKSIYYKELVGDSPGRPVVSELQDIALGQPIPFSIEVLPDKNYQVYLSTPNNNEQIQEVTPVISPIVSIPVQGIRSRDVFNSSNVQVEISKGKEFALDFVFSTVKPA